MRVNRNLCCAHFCSVENYFDFQEFFFVAITRYIYIRIYSMILVILYEKCYK